MKQIRFQNLSRALIFIALFCFTSGFSFAQFSKVEKKAIWVLRDCLYSPSSIDSVMGFASGQNFDIVFLQIRTRGDALYNSNIVAKNSNVEKGFDALEYAINLGHELDLEIHAWVNTYILWSGRTVPEDPQHLYYTRKEWTEANHYGKMDWRIDISTPPAPDWEGIYLAPTHPDVNPYLRSVVLEILKHYNIDGVHLDYIRYQDDFYGYNPVGAEIFAEQYGVSPTDIARGIVSPRFGWSEEEADSIKSLWATFKQQKITELVTGIREDINHFRPQVKLSAAVKPNPEKAKNRWSQDWATWVTTGLLDFAVPMNYTKENQEFTHNLEDIKNIISADKQPNIMMGIATYNRDTRSVVDKIILSRMNGYQSISLFSYNSHKNNLDWFIPVFDALGQGEDLKVKSKK
ncbi:MAG: glycoside hydrolase family 10 protein [Fidelibacterota bacterium]